MSPRSGHALVEDILTAISTIREYVRGMDLQAFQRDGRTIDAVVRNFIVIGEAAAHVPAEVVSGHPAIPWRLMTDMRNFAVHHYWGVEAEVLWKTIETDLPALAEQLRTMLA